MNNGSVVVRRDPVHPTNPAAPWQRGRRRRVAFDNAIAAAGSPPPRTSYKGNIAADNGLIHEINLQ